MGRAGGGALNNVFPVQSRAEAGGFEPPVPRERLAFKPKEKPCGAVWVGQAVYLCGLSTTC